MPHVRKPVEHFVTDLPSVAIDFDVEAFDSAIHSQGVRLVHYQALRCPVGLTDIDDNRRPHEDHAGCSNGFLYQRVGVATALLIGNGNDPQLRDVGFVDGASFTSTFPTHYDEPATTPPKAFYVAPFDRFYLDEENITVPTWQLVKGNETGLDKLNFPAVVVEALVDSRGDSYTEFDDFTISKGQILWAAGRGPTPDLETGRGPIYSIRYRYRPFWYVARMLHEIRVSQAGNPVTGERKVVRMQQQVMLHREFLFLNEANDDLTKDPRAASVQPEQRASRQAKAPDDGGFGSR